MTTDTQGNTTSYSDALSTGYIQGNQYITASASGPLQTVGINLEAAAGNIIVAIYDDDGSAFPGAPNNLLGQSASTAAQVGWNDLAISGPSIVQGKKYHLEWQIDSATTKVYFDTTGGQYAYYKSQAYGSFPNPMGSGGSNLASTLYNMRMTYSSPTNVNVTDSGTGSEGSVSPQLPMTDSGAGSDAETGSASMKLNETVSGADALQKIGLPIRDSGSGSELVGSIRFTILDNGVAVDNISVTGPTSINVSDAGAGLDILAKIALSAVDAGSGSDVITSISFTVTQSGSATDQSSIQGQISGTETGTGVDAPTLTAQFTSSDVGAGSDVAVFTASFTVTDAGLAVDSFINVCFTMSDVGLGSDTPTVSVSFTVTDSASFVDSWQLRGSISSVDAGSGVDVFVTISLTFSDIGSGSELPWIGFTSIDLGTGTDVFVLSFTIPDAGVGSDAGSTTASFTAGDSASGSDIPTLFISFTIFESGSGSDVPALSASLTMPDAGSGIDAYFKEYFIVGTVRDASGNPVPGATVWLFRTSDEAFIESTTANANGVFILPCPDASTQYFIRAHLDNYQGNRVFGTTDRELVAS